MSSPSSLSISDSSDDILSSLLSLSSLVGGVRAAFGAASSTWTGGASTEGTMSAGASIVKAGTSFAVCVSQRGCGRRWRLVGVVRAESGASVHRNPRHCAHAWMQSDRSNFAGRTVRGEMAWYCRESIPRAVGGDRRPRKLMGGREVREEVQGFAKREGAKLWTPARCVRIRSLSWRNLQRLC
jgi:hypothetical protein